jgi:3-oxoacyl-(acyl-carrier-protein) synthase
MINGHATATLIGDPVEAEAIKSVLGTPREQVIKEIFYKDQDLDKSRLKNTAITAFKGHLGHLNLASGASEAGLIIKAMNDGIAPGICNL